MKEDLPVESKGEKKISPNTLSEGLPPDPRYPNINPSDTLRARFQLGRKLRNRFRVPTLRFLVFLNHIRVPGFGGAGLYDVLIFFVGALSDRNFTLNAAAMAFRFFFALFPGLIFLFTLLPYFPMEGVEAHIMDFLSTVLPEKGLIMVQEVINDIFHNSKVGLLSFNFILMLFSSLGGIKAMMYAFSKLQEKDIFRRRNVFQIHFVALEIFLVLTLAFLISVILSILAEISINYVVEMGHLPDWLSSLMLSGAYYLVLFVVLFLAVSFVYYLGPETHKKFNFISPGSILSSALILLAIYGFKIFIANFANFNKFYGSMSALIILMVWFYWMSMVLLVGFELNAAIAITRKRGRVKR